MKPSFLAAFLLFAVSAFPAPASNLELLGSAKQIVQLEQVTLMEHQRKAYSNFVRDADFFSALAVSLTSEAWGSQISSNLQHSKAVALESCNAYAPEKDCRVITIVLPAGLPPTTEQLTALTPGQQKYIWKEYLQSSVQNARDYAALAGNSVYVVARYGRSFRDRAIEDALSECRRYSTRLKETLAAERYSVLEKIGALSCRVLDVTEPK
jgi:hypothetical protein